VSARRALIAGNWKMNGAPQDGAALARALRGVLFDPPAVDLAVFPPYLSIPGVVDQLKGTSIEVGGQDCHGEAKGAYTGNVAPEMLAAAGCRWVLVGHSERRTHEKEGDALLRKKVGGALRAGLRVVFCCGETLAEREANRTLEVVRGQLSQGLEGILPAELERVVLAYEPVWAIGTGKVATPQQAEDVHAAIRAWAGLRWDPGTARALRILYGGSVTAQSARSIMEQPDVDGVLVGGASLDAGSFAAIAASA
jgi:triosephosphate isomerase